MFYIFRPYFLVFCNNIIIVMPIHGEGLFFRQILLRQTLQCYNWGFNNTRSYDKKKMLPPSNLK